MHQRSVAVLTSTLLAAIALAGCGDDDTATPAPPATTPAATTPATAPPGDGDGDTAAAAPSTVVADAVEKCFKDGASNAADVRTVSGSEVGSIWPKTSGPAPDSVVVNGSGLVVAVYADVDAAEKAFAPVVGHEDVKQFGATISQRANAIVTHAPDEAKAQLDLADKCVGEADETETVRAAGE